MTKLQKVRIDNDMTQAELAEQSRINLRCLQYYEQGRKDLAHVRIDKLLRLCIILKCKICDIIDDPQCSILYSEYEKGAK